MKYYIDPKGGGDFSTLEDLEEYLLNLAKDQAIHVILRKGTLVSYARSHEKQCHTRGGGRCNNQRGHTYLRLVAV